MVGIKYPQTIIVKYFEVNLLSFTNPKRRVIAYNKKIKMGFVVVFFFFFFFNVDMPRSGIGYFCLGLVK